jgi:hypothetical protein
VLELCSAEITQQLHLVEGVSRCWAGSADCDLLAARLEETKVLGACPGTTRDFRTTLLAVKIHRSGKPITDADVQRLADEAERGYDVDAMIARRGRRGRPALGSAPSTVESVRLDPELRDQLAERARVDGTTTSEVIRQALRNYLHAA